MPGVLLGMLLAIIAGIATFVVKGMALLKRFNFGLCSGRRPEPAAPPAVSDWLAEMIEVAAGRMKRGAEPPKQPLTFADLWKAFGTSNLEEPDARDIDLRVMTTNLSMRRPNVLPDLGDKNYFFKESDFRQILPDWIVDYMVDRAKKADAGAGTDTDYYYFLPPAELPVVVAARMSLSFPFIISPVPLYRHDYSMGSKNPELCKLLFSDGGISSNFPIHFFDALLPRRPTFGVALEDFDEGRPKRRVRLPMDADEGQWIAIKHIDTAFGFLMSIIGAAKDWQDTLQSALPGYRERIVHAYLKDTEGGLNLNMPEPTIKLLVDLGDRAGSLLGGRDPDPANKDDKKPFDFDDHRWRRFLIAFARLEETLEGTSVRWGASGSGAFGDFIKDKIVAPPSYQGPTPAWRTEVFDRFDALMRHVASWQGKPLRSDPRGRIPKPATDMRITPKP